MSRSPHSEDDLVRRRLGRRPALWLAAAVMALLFAGNTLPTPLYAVYQQQLDLSPFVITLVYAIFVIGNMGALFFFGRLSDQIGRRRTVLLALAFAGAGMLVFLFVPQLAGLFVARVLTGLAVGLGAGAATAWIGELDRDRQRPRSTLIAGVATLGGLGLGPLIAGPLAQWGPSPLSLTYIVYLAAVALFVAGMLLMPETVENTAERLSDISLRPRIGVPPELRGGFIAPAASAFSTFALIGFYAAVIPGLLVQTLDQTSLAVAGAVVAELFLVAALATILTRRIDSHRAMQAGMALLVPCVWLLVAASLLRSMPLLLAVSALAGVSAALGYRGGLDVVNRLAPSGRRGEMLSTYLLCCIAGGSIPPVGVGIIGQLVDTDVAITAFAATVAVIALIGLCVGARNSPRAER